MYSPIGKLPKNIVLDYDNSLIGTSLHLNNYFFDPSKPEINNMIALELLKYAIESRLGWDPRDVRDKLSMELLKILKLDHLLQYIDFPDELIPENDLFYIAWKIWPDVKDIPDHELELKPYKEFLNNKLYKMPKEYFTGSDGLRRAANCLEYALEQEKSFPSLFDRYSFFASPQARTYLSRYRLSRICNSIFESPLDFMHSSLPDSQKNEFYFQYFTYCKKRKKYIQEHPYPQKENNSTKKSYRKRIKKGT